MEKKVRSLSCGDLTQILNIQKEADPFDKTVIVVDVRNLEEIENNGKIEGSINISLNHILSDQSDRIFSSFNKDSKIVFYCATGRRSLLASQKAIEKGFLDVWNLEGGIKSWIQIYNLPTQNFINNPSPSVHVFFDSDTQTAQYVVVDNDSKETIIIDPVLDYYPFKDLVSTENANEILKFINDNNLKVEKIIETHIHADHLSASKYLQENINPKPKICINEHVTQVQHIFRQKYNMSLNVGDCFDFLIPDGYEWKLGNIPCKSIYTPGHTPVCTSYLIGDSIFVGDTLFMPDIGTARCDFPGGDAKNMYNSIHKLYKKLPEDTRVYIGHDYPSSNRNAHFVTSLGSHKRHNKMIKQDISMETFVELRQIRDLQLKAPRYLHQSIQTNIRGGELPMREKSIEELNSSEAFFKLPINFSSL